MFHLTTGKIPLEKNYLVTQLMHVLGRGHKNVMVLCE